MVGIKRLKLGGDKLRLTLSNGATKEYKLENGNYFFKSFVGGNWLQVNNKKYIKELDKHFKQQEVKR